MDTIQINTNVNLATGGPLPQSVPCYGFFAPDEPPNSKPIQAATLLGDGRMQWNIPAGLAGVSGNCQILARGFQLFGFRMKIVGGEGGPSTDAALIVGPNPFS